MISCCLEVHAISSRSRSPSRGEIENLFLQASCSEISKLFFCSFIHASLIHSFNKYILNSITVMFLIIDAEDTVENKTNTVPASRETIVILSVRNKHQIKNHPNA